MTLDKDGNVTDVAIGDKSAAAASVTSADGKTTTYYESLDYAMSVAKNGETVTVLKADKSGNEIVAAGVIIKSTTDIAEGMTFTTGVNGAKLLWKDKDDGDPNGLFISVSNYYAYDGYSVTVSAEGSDRRSVYALTGMDTYPEIASSESDFTVRSDAGAYGTVTGVEAGKSVSIEQIEQGASVVLTAAASTDEFSFDQNGSVTLKSTDSSVTVPAGTAATVGIDGGKAVTVPSTNTGDTVVTKKSDGGSEVTLAESGDKVTVNNVTYTAASAGTVLGFDKDGNATLSSGALNLAANTGAETPNGNTITNAGTSTVILGTNLTGYDGKDAVFVASGGSFTVKNGDKTQTYTAAGDVTDAALYLVDNAGNVTLADGTSNLADGQELTGASGQKIGNPASSSDDTITVEASNTSSADLVTVPEGGKVVIGGTEYDNAGTDDMLLEVTSDADGNPVVTLEGGSLALDPGDGFGVNGAGITAPDTNKSPIVVTANEDGSKSVTVQPGDSLTYTDENGNEHTIEVPADGEAMTFTVNEDGSITTPSLGDGESVIIDGTIYEGASDGDDNKVTLNRDGTVTIDPDGDVNSADEQKVSDFIEKYATGSDGKVFTGATADNYEQILSGADAWNALSDGEKAIINSQLVANGGATFDELLAGAQQVKAQIDAENAKKSTSGSSTTSASSSTAKKIVSTGDMLGAAIPIALIVALAAGAAGAYALTRRPRGKHVK